MCSSDLGAFPKISSSNSTTVNFSYTSGSISTIIVNAVNLCGNSSPSKKNVTVNILCRTQPTQGETASIIVTPNPSKGHVNVQFDVAVEKSGLMLITDILGNTILEKPLDLQVGFNSSSLDLSGLNAGVYLVRLQIKGEPVRMTRLVIE